MGTLTLGLRHVSHSEARNVPHMGAAYYCVVPSPWASHPRLAAVDILTTGNFLRSSFRRIPSLSSTRRLEAEYTEGQRLAFRGGLQPPLLPCLLPRAPGITRPALCSAIHRLCGNQPASPTSSGLHSPVRSDVGSNQDKLISVTDWFVPCWTVPATQLLGSTHGVPNSHTCGPTSSAVPSLQPVLESLHHLHLSIGKSSFWDCDLQYSLAKHSNGNSNLGILDSWRSRFESWFCSHQWLSPNLAELILSAGQRAQECPPHYCRG